MQEGDEKSQPSHITLRDEQSSHGCGEAGAPFPPTLHHKAGEGKETPFHGLSAAAGFLIATVATPTSSRSSDKTKLYPV